MAENLNTAQGANAARVKVVDTTLRDGSHAVSHSYTEEQVRAVAAGLDAAGLELIEISHGDGITGSTYNYGFSGTDERKLIAAASEVVKNSKLAILLLPGIGTIEDLKEFKKLGAQAVRVATHVTEADISAQHIAAAKDMDMLAVGFLMMT
ncbi:MAG: 4-hydroxy-2-oxovalerate aldolase, partial [Clostridiales Family XIII bacterium]|nr:4-hydroxy-2-oxovalerate aldolase [Clostridiales Family XIII bacterium]